MSSARPASIDDYLAGVRPEHRAALEALRAQIHAAAPGATEAIGYGIPAIKLDGKTVVSFGDAAGWCSLYPMSAAVVEAFAGRLAGFSTSKGTIRFQPDRPIPPDIVAGIVSARIAENATLIAARAARKQAGKKSAS